MPGQNLAHRTPTEKGNEKESRFVLPEKNQKNLLRSIKGKTKTLQREIDPLRNKGKSKLTECLKCLCY